MQSLNPLSRESALACWRAFLPKVGAYGGLRNHVQAGHDNVSRLGASIRFRTLLEDEIVQETLAEHSFQDAEKWLQEVCWRRYWKGWLEARPQVWKQYRLRLQACRKELPKEALARAHAVMAGESGVACMDRIARELIETGYLHNHARMWWASFWIHVERLPWELGADFFFRHLLDADPASNTLSWRWVAGLQTQGKSYIVRLSNIEKYAPDYLSGNARGSERLADGAVSACVPHAFDVFEKEPQPQYPTAFHQNATNAGLWLHPDDLAPEIGPLASMTPVSIAACISERVYADTYNLSRIRTLSLSTVLQDGLNRAAAHYGRPALAVESADPVLGLCSWARECELAEIVTFAPMVGPIRDMLPRLRKNLEPAGVRLTLIRRPSDQVAFSFATAGFFPFWQKMSRHLKALHSL
jgi:deoxyribodipyrimidine photo-lyase